MREKIREEYAQWLEEWVDTVIGQLEIEEDDTTRWEESSSRKEQYKTDKDEGGVYIPKIHELSI